MPALPDAIDDLQSLLWQGPYAVVTGAGLSTGSGIPAYRDQAGQWQHPRPVQHQEFIGSEAVRRRYWARSFMGWPRMGLAAPNAGHQAIAVLQQAGHLGTVITQNVDGLHTKAGTASVVELHGGIARVVCLACGHRLARASVQETLQALNPDFREAVAAEAVHTAPDGDAHLADDSEAGFRIAPCPACQGVLKPDVVFFGDNVPRERVATATQAIDDAAGLLVVGSSLMVYSGYRFAEQAHRLGKLVVAINQGITRADHLLGFKIEADCGQALEALRLALGAPRDAPTLNVLQRPSR